MTDTLFLAASRLSEINAELSTLDEEIKTRVAKREPLVVERDEIETALVVLSRYGAPQKKTQAARLNDYLHYHPNASAKDAADELDVSVHQIYGLAAKIGHSFRPAEPAAEPEGGQTADHSSEVPAPLAGESAGSDKRRTGMADAFKKLHDAHPDWSDLQFAEALDCDPSYVRNSASRLGLKLAPRQSAPDVSGLINGSISEVLSVPGKPFEASTGGTEDPENDRTTHSKHDSSPAPGESADAKISPNKQNLTSRIRALLVEFPDLTAAELGKRLGLPTRDIHKAAGKADIKLRKLTKEELQESRRLGGRIHGKTEPTASAEPSLHIVSKSKEFRLRDKVTKEYLHTSVVRKADGKPLMTSLHGYPWKGTESQLIAVRRALPETIEFQIVPVEPTNGR